MARSRLDHVDAMRPVKQAGVISTHAILYFAPAAASAGSGAALLLLHVSREGFFFISGSRHHPAQKQRLGSRSGNGDRREARVGSSGAVLPGCKIAARAGYLALSAAGARWRVRYTVAREMVNTSARSVMV
jgi:hypothetical protein